MISSIGGASSTTTALGDIRAACERRDELVGVWNRRAGSFSSARRTTASSAGGTVGLSSRGGTGASDTCLSATDTGDSASNGTRPVSSS